MSYILKKHISSGVIWVAIEEAGLFICCGCPADTVKHLKKDGVIASVDLEGVTCENGPNAILLSDTLIQNGQVANLTEFVILQMLYLQGVNLPNHPNYQKWRPLLIGYKNQIQMQLDYVSVGNHGLESVEEIMDAGINQKNAQQIFATKIYYSGGKINPMDNLVDTCVVDNMSCEIRNGAFIKRLGLNKFEISYKNESVEVDLNIKENEHFLAPYSLPFKNITPGMFSITHTGEGNGWDENRPCMASIIHHNNRVYLIDAGPNILNNLSYLGIGLSEIDGIFLSHIHDDHFAGITELLNVERKLNFYSTKLVRFTAEKKLQALMNSELDLIHLAFNCIDLEFGEWAKINGMEVKPLYSPHTVETSTYNFRVRDGDVFKTYTHLSDTINLKEFKVIVEKSPEIFSEKEISYVEKSYLSKVDLKKIDVGGGVIHGHLSDYAHDESDLIVIAHTSKELLAGQEKFINVDFGKTHILIEDKDQSFFKIKSRTYLKNYFDMVEEEEIDLLSSNKIRVFRPGEMIISKENRSKLYLIISGLVNYKNESGIERRLDAGNFIGYSKRYFRNVLPDQYAAWSFVHCIEYEESFLNRFILNYDLIDDLNSRINMMRVLQGSVLIHNELSNAIINWLSRNAEMVKSVDYLFDEYKLKKNLYIIFKGNAQIEFETGQTLTIGEGEHFGGMRLMYDYRRNQHFLFEDELEAISIPVEEIMKIPKLLWRLLELEEKRYQMSMYTS